MINTPAHVLGALTPEQRRHKRFLDAQAAFGISTGLRMVDPPGGSGGSGDGGDGGTGTGSGGTGDGGTGTGTGSGGTGSGSGVPDGYAVDAQGRSLGFPKDTAITAMTDAQQAAYWRHNAQKHEGRYKSLTGDRSFDETKAALERAAELEKAQQTPAEQQLTAAREEGKQAGMVAANTTAAKAIFEGNLRAGQMADADVAELMKIIDVAPFISDGQIDTAGLVSAASRFTSAKDNQQQQRRDFGGGQRNEGAPEPGAQGKAQLARRHPQTQQS